MRRTLLAILTLVVLLTGCAASRTSPVEVSERDHRHAAALMQRAHEDLSEADRAFLSTYVERLRLEEDVRQTNALKRTADLAAAGLGVAGALFVAAFLLSIDTSAD